MCLCKLGGATQTAGLGLSRSYLVVFWCLVSEEEGVKVPLSLLLFCLINNPKLVKTLQGCEDTCPLCNEKDDENLMEYCFIKWIVKMDTCKNPNIKKLPPIYTTFFLSF